MILPKPIPNPGVLTNPQVITLANGELANSLGFFAPYTLTGGSLALTSGQIAVTIGNASTIESLLTGGGGLIKLNDGALKLTNASNDYTGTTRIDSGSIIITDQGALGVDSSAVIVTGSLTRGVGGGSLVVGSADNNLTGLTFTRDLELTGGGASGDGAAFNSVGNNVFTGSIVTGNNPAGLNPVGGTAVTASGTRMASTFGLATVAGTLSIGPSGQSTELTGNGNWLVSSDVTGDGNLVKSGNGLLVLSGNNTFGGVLQLSGGYVRVSSEANLGSSLANNAIFLTNGGKIEFRSDMPDFTTSKRVQLNTGTTSATIYLDREIGGSGMNETVNLGLLTLGTSTSTRTLVVDGRNGYNLSFTGNMASASQGAFTVTNNGNGLFTNAGHFWGTNNTAQRILTFNGNGDFLITGNINATGNDHIVTKTGSGTLTLNGTNSSFTGTLNVNGGTVAINDFRAINNNSSVIDIGTGSTTATFSVIGNNLSGANVTTDKVINLGGTTGGAILLANQTGTSPGLRFNANFTATGGSAGNAKTVTLGGTSMQDNTILGVIPNNAAGGLVNVTKIDPGTWVLGGANTYTGTTTITNGILKLQANAETSTVLPSTNGITFGNNNVNAGGTLEFVGQDGVDNHQSLGALNYASSGGAATVRLTPGLLGTASLTFADIGTGAGGTINFVGGDFTDNTFTLTQVNTAVGGNGIITRSIYWNGADFAYREGGVLRAPVYGTDAGTVTSDTALGSGHNEITGSFSTGSATVSTLKINGSQTLTLDPGATLTINGYGLLATGGSALIEGGAAVATGSASQALVVRVDGGTDTLRIEGPITGGGLTKSGEGTLILAGENAQTGTFTLGEGTVRLSGSGRLSADNRPLNIRQNATLDLNGVSTGASISTFNSNGTVTNSGSADVTLSIGNGVTTNGTAGTINGIIEDGPGGGRTSVSYNTNNNNAAQNTTYALNGLSTYTGATTLTKTQAGNLILTVPNLSNIGEASSIGSGDATSDATNAASLVFSGAASATQVFATLNYTGRASLATDRLFTFGGTESGSGARIRANGVNDATLVFSNPGALAFANPDIDQGLALGGASIGSNQFNPLITDNGTGVVGLYKQDAGLWILGNPANSYTGITRIDAGALRAEGTTLPSGSPLVFNGGVLQSGGTFTRSLTSTPTPGAGGVSWTGNGGFAAATEKLTVNIGGNVVPDTLQWGVGGFVSGNLILSSTTAFAEVEILNPIDLNGGVRTIQVDTNPTTNSDQATLSGAIGGGAGSGFTKTGSGILRLLGENTYEGDTAINAGTVRAVSIGNSTSVSSNFGTGAGKITIGSGTTTGTLAYVGGGETSDRLVEITGTADANSSIRASIIESSGTGPLILNNVSFKAVGTAAGHRRALYLRGDSNVANEITSDLADNGPNAILNIVKDDNGTWILSGASTYTGTTTVSAGPMGFRNDGTATSGPFGVGTLIISNGSLFALDGDRTLDQTVRLNANASSNFIGVNSITLNSIETGNNGNTTVTNMLPSGKLLTLNSPTFAFSGTDTTNRTFVFNGSGDTILNAPVTNNTGNVISLTYNGYGSLTLGGGNGASTYTGATTISSGTLRIGSTNALPNGATASDVTMNPGSGLSATLDLNGFDQTINGLVANSLGTANIDNSSASPATFTFGSQDRDVNLIGGVTNSGGGALSLVKIGTGTATMVQGPFTYGGTTTVNGGSLTISADVTATTGISVGAGAFLAFTEGLSGASGVTSVSVGAGGELRFLNSTGEPLDNLTSLILGSGSTLGLNAGATSDTLTLLAGNVASVGGPVSLRIRDTGSMLGGSTYNLLEASSGGLLTGGGSSGSYSLAAIPGGFTTLTLNQTDTLVSLTTGTLVSDKRYWTGATDSVWNTVNGTFDGLNWSPDKSGATVSAFIPGSGTTVVFSADNAAGGALTTTLEQGFRINALEFESSSNTATSVTIASGTDANNRLIISPSSPLEGITMKAGGPGTVEISAPLRVDTDQTWTVADGIGSLTLSGGLSGPGSLTIDGSGQVNVTAAASGTFAIPSVVVDGGTLRIEDVGALGTTVAGNAAHITVNPGAAFYQNGPTNTVTTAVNNALTLAGGTLSAGGSTSNHYFTGAVDVTADSFINLRDSNSATLSDSQTNIILNGALTGTGKLTVDSNNAASSGNQINGILYLQNDNSGWSGGFDLLRGTIQVQNLAGFGTGDVNASAGRIQFNMTANNTVDLAQNFTVDAPGGVLELSADAQGTLSGDLVVNLNGVITLGSVANADNALRLVTSGDNFSILNLTNSIVLGNNASISFNGSTIRTMDISAVISETGGARSLAINDDLGGWGQTNDTVRLSGANTFTGELNHSSGTLEFGTVSDIGGPASNLGRGSSISVGAATLSFIGDTTSQSTNRTITQTGTAVFSANGTNGATITYAGAIDAGANAFTLSGTPGSGGLITGGLTQTGTTADGTINGGSWTFSGGLTTVADNLSVTGSDTVLNLGSTGVLAFLSGAASGDLTITDGATVNINADNPVDMTIPYRLFVGQGGNGATAVLNLGSNNIESGRFILGERSSLRNGIVNGTGTLTVVGGDIELYEGAIHANLASTGSSTFDKFGPGTVTLTGDNSGLASTGATIVNDGTLILDYTTSNTTKIRAASQLNMIGGNLEIIGNASAATSQSVGSFTQGNGGSNYIKVSGSGGQDAVLILGNITRGNVAQDGTVRFTLPSGTPSATNGITTTSPNSTFGLLGTGATSSSDSAYATVDDGTGLWFATANGGNIVALVSTVKNDVTTWAPGDHVTDDTTGFTGIIDGKNIHSLRFDAGAGSDLEIESGGALLIGSGGLLLTGNTGGTPSLLGGTLASGATELVITQSSAQTFLIGSDIRINHAVTKSGSGTLQLTGNNTYTGYTEIQEGTLQIGGGNAIGDGSLVQLASNRDTLLELFDSETIGRLAGGRRATDSEYGTVAIGAHTLTINETGNTTYAGLFTGSGTIVLQGGFDLTTQNASTGFNGDLIINGSTYRLNNIASTNATSITVNAGGTLMLDMTGTTRSGTRLLDTAPIILNSANGTSQNTGFGTITTVRGLWVRTDQDGTLDETVGAITARSGASYISLEATTASDDADLIANDLLRLNNATINVRGTNLGVSNSRNNLFRIGDSTNQSAFIASLVGGGASSGTDLSIVPWAIGEDLGSNVLTDVNMGNSLVTYVAGTGFRALNLSTEYAGFASAGSMDNVRESLGADLTGLGGKTINSFVVDNAAFAGLDFTGAGAGNGLAVTSGAFLFTVSGATAGTPYDTTLGGFDDGISVGSTNEYVFHVVNPSSAADTATLTATIASPLTSGADLTKSGRGTLVLTGVNTAGGGPDKTTLNEGVLEIADLDNIGGNTGDLVFSGGTLRLGAGLTDDLSLRNIVFFNGGGTIDTNGVDLALANSAGSGAGGLTKAGSGTLTLNAAATYTGNTAVTGGILAIGADNATGLGGDLSIGAGGTLALGANSLTAGLVTFSGADPVISGTGTINASTGFFFDHDGGTDLVTVDAILAGPGGIFKANRLSNLSLTGLNTFTGTVEFQRGTLTFNSIANVGGGASALGAPETVEDGIIRMGITTQTPALTYTGSGHATDRIIEMQGTTGGLTINGDGTGALQLGRIQTVTNGNKTLTLSGLSDPSIVNSVGEIREVGSSLTLVKSEGNTWQINEGGSYTGATQINDGTLMIGLDNALPTGTAVRIGTGTTAGTLDLNGFNQTIASLSVQTNSDAVTNQLIVDTGTTLTINGAVSIGTTSEDGNTNFNALGGGSVNVVSGNANFIVGAATAATNSRVDVDFSGLGNFTADLGTGFLRLGDPNTDTEDNPSTFRLAVNNTITAAQIRIGDGSGGGVPTTHTLTLGSGTNLFNTDALNIGSAGATTRSGGAIVFDGGDTTGTFTLRASDGTGRAVVNLINTTGSTTSSMEATLDLAGHTADILASTLTMASRTQNAGAATATLNLDQGTLDATTLNMASRTGAGTGNATATVNLGGGTTAIGTLNMAVNTSAGGTVLADFNVSGGNVSIGNGSGTAINMANAGTGRTVTSTIDLTGGTVSVTGNIVRTGGAGTEDATITLDGATLDLNGNDIGTLTETINLTAQSGTLRNLGELNGGGSLVKTGTGTLVLEGDNAYTGSTIVTDGILSISSEDNLGDNPAVFNAAQLEIDGGTLQTTASLAINDVNRGITIGTGGGIFDIADSTEMIIGSGNAIVLTGNLTKTGNGALYIDSTTSGAGAITVSAGTIGGTGSIGTTTVESGATLRAGNLIGDQAELTFTELSLDAGSTWLVDLVNGSINGSDQIHVTANDGFSIAGELLINEVSGTFSGSTSYQIATYAGSLSGTFSNDVGGIISNGSNSWYVDYSGGAITLTAVPEPGTLGLLGLGLGGVLYRRIRRKRSKG